MKSEGCHTGKCPPTHRLKNDLLNGKIETGGRPVVEAQIRLRRPLLLRRQLATPAIRDGGGPAERRRVVGREGWEEDPLQVGRIPPAAAAAAVVLRYSQVAFRRIYHCHH